MKRFRYNGKTRKASDFTRQTSGLCAAASVANACRVVDLLYKYTVVTETTAAMAMGLRQENVQTGADQNAIKRGLLKLGFKTRRRTPDTKIMRVLATGDYAKALTFAAQYACIIPVDGDTHWLVLVIDEQQRPVLIDSDNTAEMLSRISLTELERRWRHQGLLYAVAVR